MSEQKCAVFMQTFAASCDEPELSPTHIKGSGYFLHAFVAPQAVESGKPDDNDFGYRKVVEDEMMDAYDTEVTE